MNGGGELVSDDQVRLERRDMRVFASPPEVLAGMIVARGVGLLRGPYCVEAEVVLVVDLNQTETKRLPDVHMSEVLGVELPLIFGQSGPILPMAVLHYLRHGDLTRA